MILVRFKFVDFFPVHFSSFVWVMHFIDGPSVFWYKGQSLPCINTHFCLFVYRLGFCSTFPLSIDICDFPESLRIPKDIVYAED